MRSRKSAAPAMRIGVRDHAKMFSPEAVKKADGVLEETRRKSNWGAILETVETLGDKSLREAAVDQARASQVHGIYVLIAKKERKIYAQPSTSAAKVFPPEKARELENTITTAFKKNELDTGLLEAVAAIRQDAEANPTVAAPAPPEPAQFDLEIQARRERGRSPTPDPDRPRGGQARRGNLDDASSAAASCSSCSGWSSDVREAQSPRRLRAFPPTRCTVEAVAVAVGRGPVREQAIPRIASWSWPWCRPRARSWLRLRSPCAGLRSRRLRGTDASNKGRCRRFHDRALGGAAGSASPVISSTTSLVALTSPKVRCPPKAESSPSKQPPE